MSKYSTLLARSAKEQHAGEDIDYHVMPISVLEHEVPCIGLAFQTRDLARQYKKLLKRSLAKLDAKIVRREFLDGYIVSQTEVH